LDIVKYHKGEKKVDVISTFFALVQGDSPCTSRAANFFLLIMPFPGLNSDFFKKMSENYIKRKFKQG